jgi:2-aminoadipate transaminase
VDPRIERLQRRASPENGVIGLGGGLPANELFPRAKLSRAFLGVLDRPNGDGLQYGWPEGSRGLRAWIASRMRDRGVALSEDDVIVTSGAQQGLSIAAEVLRTRGDTFEVDPESYPAAIDLFRARGLRLVSPRRGPVAEAVVASYVMPGVCNPRGHGLSPARRAELLARRAAIIADEAYAELRFDGTLERPLLADARDRTWHIGTFSKTLCPGLRIGYLIPPRDDRERALTVKHELDLQAPGLAQAILEEFLARDEFDHRLARARQFYGRRAGRLLSLMRRAFPSFRITEPEGGFCLYVETDAEGDDAAFLALATEHGVSFDPGSLFRHDRADAPIAMRLCYSSATIPELKQAVERLQKTFRAWARAPRRASRG